MDYISLAPEENGTVTYTELEAGAPCWEMKELLLQTGVWIRLWLKEGVPYTKPLAHILLSATRETNYFSFAL